MKQADPNLPRHLNLIILFGVQALVLLALYGASRLGWGWSIVIGVVTSFVLLTNYALIHEGTHHNLHPNRQANWLLGTLSGFLFPVSFTFMQVAHQVHHDHNRTDHEMFDYYYPDDNLPVKYAQWYSILIGIYPPIIPLGSVLMGLAPWVFKAKPFAQARSSAVLFANQQYNAPQIWRIRLELLLGGLYWFSIWHLLDLQWLPVLIIYACFCFNWSTRQYVTHAFTQRDVIEGALNLKVSKLMGWVLLNSQWDQVHHKHPGVSWVNLPQYANSTMQPVSYWRQYFKLWKGPRPNPEPAPKPIKT